jgi:hypothetical protein
MFLDKTVQDLNEHVQECTAELVINLNEIGISDWEDRKMRNVVVMATMRGQMIHHGISRTVKHISVIAYVSAACESPTPYIISSEDCALVQEQLKKHDVRFGRDLASKLNRKPYMTAEIFLFTSRLCSYLILLNSGRWMHLL